MAVLRRWAAVGAIMTALSMLPPTPAGADTLTVDTTLDGYDGSCGDGDCSLRDAVAVAVTGDTITLPAGFYALTITEAGGPGDGSLTITEDIRIVAGGETGSFVDASTLGSTPFVVANADVTISGLTVFGASTDAPAGIGQVSDGTLRMRDTTLTGGDAVSAGALFAGPQGRVIVAASLILDNVATDGAGGAFAHPTGELRAIDSTFTDNRGDRGGALGGPIAVLRNVTITRNQAAIGGGIRTGFDGRWRQVTIVGNRADTGGAFSLAASAEAPKVDHVVIADNGPARHQCAGRLRSLGWNVSSGRGCGFDRRTDQAGVDPMLGAVAANGGPTPTAALRVGSPALDVGGDCTSRDQRGAPRRGRCDAGAYERVLCRGRAVDIVGTPGADELSGGRDDDTFLGLGGDDEFQGSLGQDRACAGPGADHVLGGPGADDLQGGAGSDTLDGEAGTDRCTGGPGRDELIACEP